MNIEKIPIFAGCDPGLNGGWAVVLGDKIYYKIAMPTLSFTKSNSKTKTEIDREGVLSFLSTLPLHTHVVIEEQKAFRGQDITSSCTICRNYGILQMALTTAHMYAIETPPAVWHEFFGIVSSKEGEGTTKEQAFRIAQKLFPNTDFYKSDRSRKPHDGMVDASLIAVYCKSLFTHVANAPSDAYLDWCDKQGVVEER